MTYIENAPFGPAQPAYGPGWDPHATPRFGACCDPTTPYGPVGTAYDAQGKPYVAHYGYGYENCPVHGPQMLFADPRFRSPSALGDYVPTAPPSPAFAFVGLSIAGAEGLLAWYLWKHQHPVWASVLGLMSLSAAGYNLYNLAAR